MKIHFPSNDQIAVLPTHLARMAKALDDETSPRLKLWNSLELSEMSLKWIFAVLIAGAYSKNGELSQNLISAIQGVIKKPTFGQWRAMTEAASEEITDDDNTTFVQFANLFSQFNSWPKDASGDEASIALEDARAPWAKRIKDIGCWGALIEKRNHFVHGGAITETAASDVLEDTLTILRPMIDALCKIHQSRVTWATFDGVSHLLRGPDVREAEPPAHLPKQNGTWLVDETGVLLSLRPLLVYAPVRDRWESGLLDGVELKGRELVPQSYFSYEKSQLFYTPIGVDDFVSVDPDTTDFFKKFPDMRPQSDQTIMAHQIDRARTVYAARFIGRLRELDTIDTWISEASTRGGLIGLIKGDAGFGKSALIAKHAVDRLANLKLGGPETDHIVYHAFSVENPFNDRRQFLINVLQQTQIWKGQAPTKTGRAGDTSALFSKVEQALDAGLRANPSRFLYVYVDGLDEIATLDKNFFEVLSDLLRPGVVIVATTRPDARVTAFDASRKVEFITFNGTDSLPRMTDADIRGMLLQGLGERARDVIALDHDVNGQSYATNGYIDRVVAHAAGKPIYIELLIEDTLNNQSKIDINARLPVSLEGFYGKILSRQGLSDSKTHVSLIICVLALAREPLSERMLVDLFDVAPRGAVTESATVAWVRNALGQAELFLAQSETVDAAPGFILYHQAFKEFVMGRQGKGADQLRWMFGFAQWLLAAASTGAHDFGEELSRHIDRQGAQYILAFADRVLPRVTELGAHDFVALRFLTAEGYKRAFSAWNGSKEQFLLSFADAVVVLAEKRESDALNKTVPGLLDYLIDQFPVHGIESGVIHSSIGYSEQYAALYAAIIQHAISDGFRLRFEEQGLLRHFAGWLADEGGRMRRLGRLEEAETYLKNAEAIVSKTISGDANEANRQLSRIYYELGFVAFYSSNRDGSSENLRKSAEFARRAGDRIGESMATVPLHRIAADFERADDTFSTKATDDFEAALKALLADFLRQYNETSDEGERLNAERWIMSCRGHLCDVAHYRADAIEADLYLQALRDDPWLRKSTDKIRRDVMQIRLARQNRLTGDIMGAAAEYASFLTHVSDQIHPDANREGFAQYYLEYAETLLLSGDANRALLAIESGLRMNDAMANAHWKGKLKTLKANLSKST